MQSKTGKQVQRGKLKNGVFKIYENKAQQNLQHMLITCPNSIAFFLGCTTHMFQPSAQKQFQASNQVESA